MEESRYFYMEKVYRGWNLPVFLLNAEGLLAFRHEKKQPSAEVPGLTLQQALCALSVLYAGVTGQMLSEEEIAKASGLQSIHEESREAGEVNRATWQMKLFEKNLTFKTYEDEKNFMEEFRRGQMRINDAVILRDMWELEGVGSLARDDFRKQCEYAVVSAAALMRSAAIEEGVPGTTGYRIVDNALLELTKADTPVEIMYVYRDVVNELGEEICRAKGREDSDVLQDRCKDYVARHIRTSFTIREMAADLGYNASYLSRKFSETEGMTLQQYIMKERLRMTANLLKNSDEKIGTISEYMGFPSQNRMTEQFTREYGMSPTEYRRKSRS